MAPAHPGSLPEGAGSPQGLTEGVSFDGSTGPMVYSQFFIGSEIYERLRSSKYTPSVSLRSTAPSERELARPTGVTEGVSSDGCSMPMVYSQFFIGSEIFERLRSSKYTPSVSHSLDSSLREGAGKGRVLCIVPPGNRKAAGDFHRPYGTLNVSHFTIQRTTLPQSRFARQLPQRGSRGGVRTIQRSARKPEGCGRFSSPLRNSKTVSFYHSSGNTPSVSFADSSLREGAGDGAGAIQRAARKPQDCGRFSSPLRNSKTVSFYHSSGYTPSVSLSLDSSLREGAGMGCVPFNVPPKP